MELTKMFDSSKVRIILKNDEPFFAAVDVCTVLEIKNPSQAISYLDKDDLTTNEVIDSMGRTQKANYVNESGLYQLIFRSRKDSAKRFKKWVTSEVLPSIRKTGKYSIPQEIKQLSKKNRNALTSEWKNHGINNPKEYVKLTLQEYRGLGFEKDKRKKDLSKGETLLLSALESMESLKLFNNNKINGVDDCSKSLSETTQQIKQITGKSGELE